MSVAPPVPRFPLAGRANDGRYDLAPAAAGSGRVVVDTVAGGAAFDSQWDRLAESAADRNAFAMRWFVQPSLRHCASGGDCELVSVRRDDTLIGLFPLIRRSIYGHLFLPHVASWSHPNMFLAGTLVADGMAADAWTALIEMLARRGESFLLVGPLDRDGKTAWGLVAAADQAGSACRLVKSEERALIDTSLDPEAYWLQAVRGKKRKELRRQERRLGELGTVTFDWLDEIDALDGWCDQFLALESAGWKGAEHSALAASPITAGLFRETLRQAQSAGALAFCRLTLDGRPIAMLATLIAGKAGFSFKTAYDESLAAYSPGVLLQRHNLDLLERAGLDWIDSCAAPGHPMIDSLWTERRRLGWYAVPLAGGVRRTVFDVVHGAKAFKRRMIARTRAKGAA